MDNRCNRHPVHCSRCNRHEDTTNTINTINTGRTMLALTLIIINLMAMAIYIPYLLDKERKYDNETDTTSKPIRTGYLHKATASK